MISGILTSCGLLGTGGHKPSIPGKIVFSATDKAGTDQIFTMNADGSHRKQLTHFPTDGGGGEPAWSPDGTKIAYDVCLDCERGGGNYEIMTVEVAGEEYDSTQVHRLTNNPASDEAPSWSPDGKKIVFSSDRDYYTADTMRWRRDLYMVNADGTDLRRLTRTGNAELPKYSSDGTRIAYSWGHDNAVFLYNIESGKINRYTGIGLGYPLWNKQGNQLLVFAPKANPPQLELNWISLENDVPKILKTMTLEGLRVRIDNFDWYSDQ